MGKASRWFRGLLGLKKAPDQPPPTSTTTTHTENSKSSKERRKWSFGKSYREKNYHNQNTTPTNISTDVSNRRGGLDGSDPSKHAISVAAATAAVADAAVIAANAAAAVVRLTSSHPLLASSSNRSVRSREDRAALKIQSAFRGYLAKRALRALRGLVKLQAIVRGHIVRNRTEDTWRRMQVLLRAQTRACSGRALVSDSPLSSGKSSHFHCSGPATPEKFEHVVRAKTTRQNQPSTLKRNGSKSHSRRINEESWIHRTSTRTHSIDVDNNDKILEIDTGKPLHKPRNHFHSAEQTSHSFTTSKDSTTQHETEEVASFCTAENSPQLYSASSKYGSSRRGPFTPTKSDGSKSYMSSFSDHPNYMAYTESSKAKLRSLSAPRQRPVQFERSGSATRYSVHGFCSDTRSTSGQKVTAMRDNFSSKAYPGSGRLDRLGMPVASGFYSRC